MNDKEKHLAIFEGRQIRRHWDEKSEKWFFSVVDIIETLTKSERPRKYWDDLKRRLNEEGSELSAKIGQLKMVASDGKMRLTDAADTEVMLRLVQSIPSAASPEARESKSRRKQANLSSQAKISGQGKTNHSYEHERNL